MFALVLISLCGLPIRARGVGPDVQKVLDARYEAVKALQAYSQNSNYDKNVREIAARMAFLLTKAGIGVAVGAVARDCNANSKMAAAGEFKSQNVWLCAYAFSLGKGSLTQVFIHESYHLYEGADYYRLQKPELYKKFISNGFDMTPEETQDSEMRAATMEFEIITKIFKCVFFKTEYFESLLNKVEGRSGYLLCKQ